MVNFFKDKKSTKSLQYIIGFCLIGWVALIASSFFMHQGAMKISVLAAKIEFGVHAVILLLVYQIFKSTSGENRKAMCWLFVISFLLFLADFLFYIAAYANNTYLMKPSFIQFLFYYAPCIIYCFVMITFLSKLLLKQVMHTSGFIKIVSVLIFINVITIFLFLSSIDYAFGIISWQTISQMALLTAELVVFNFAILGLIYANNTSVVLLLSGTILLVSGDFFLTYSSISQTVPLFSYGELLWLLGLLFDMFAFISMKQNKHFSVGSWFRKSTTIKSRLAFWAFGISISGFLLFFVIVYIFSIVNKEVYVGLPLFVMMYSVIVVILSIWMGKNFEIPFKKIAGNIEALKESNTPGRIDDDFSTEEFIYLQKFIVDAFEFKEEKDRAKKELGEITAQVAHDIRSPLAALDMIMSSISDKVPEQERIMMRTAFRRINNIANDLVAKYKGRECNNRNISLFVYVVLKDIVSEKDLEYKNQNIGFELVLDDAQSAFLLTEGNYKEMRRMFSNLINNAINAMPTGGHIKISCEKNGQNVAVRIIDQGVGLSEQKIAQLLSDDEAAKAGIGLGLKHAKDYVKKHNGSFDIISSAGRGTEVILSFPALPKPVWLAQKLEIDFDSSVMIVDDDTSIHDLWTKKLEGLDIKREDYYTPKDARYALHESGSMPGTILCDYEFIGQDEVGLQFLESIKDITADKYLVTTHVDNEEIIDRCENLGLQLLPKHLLPYVSITKKRDKAQELFAALQAKKNKEERVAVVNQEEKTGTIDAVLIDDDLYNHEFWQYAANEKNKVIKCFISKKAFLEASAEISKDVPIYVDLNLKDERGLEVAKALSDMGYKKLYIATGYADFDEKDYPYLSGVTGKKPPF